MNDESAFALMMSAALLFILGMLPHKLMDVIAEAASPFMHGGEAEEEVRYFAFSNLKGGLISIAIGLFIYFVMIRKLLMKKDEEGNKVYIDAWPKWLDVEDLIYRPFLQHILPFVLAFVLRIFDRMTDHIISILSRSVLKEVEPRRPLLYGNMLTRVIGVIMDRFVVLLNKTVRRKSPKYINYEQKLAFGFEEILKASRLTTRSVSYGLLMFSVGCIFTLIYLLVMLLLHVSS